MLTSSAPSLAPSPPPVSSGSLESWNWGWEEVDSVCQLQLMGLVQQRGAAAGWICYGDGLVAQRRGCQVVAPGAAKNTMLEAETVISGIDWPHLIRRAAQVQPEVWALGQRLSLPRSGWIGGLKFRVPLLGAEWAYLLLWFPDALGVDPPSHPWPEPLFTVGALQRAIRLDQAHQHRRQQVHHYQQILRRLEHQLRHPLAMVHLYAANLQNGLTQERDRRQAQTIREAVGQLSNQLTDLIAGCQRSQVQAEVCSVPDLWAEAWQGVRLSAQAKQVELVLEERPLALSGDRAQLLQAFTNLLHNALCFSPSQGRIVAQWQAFQREVVITLADQGPGLSPTDLQHMFRPYYSNRPQGSGLGLTIARQIVQQHGGKLWAENLPQGGAQFSMVLPLSSPDAGRSPVSV